MYCQVIALSVSLEESKTLTLGSLALATTTADSDAVDEDALLGLVSQAASLLGTSRARAPVDDVQLAVLPGADAQQEAHHIRLLVTPNLLHVLVCTHDGAVGSRGIQQGEQLLDENTRDPRRKGKG